MLESTLAKLRARKADQLILPEQRAGRILDIGCGSFPFFLVHTRFHEKHGLDRVSNHPERTAAAGVHVAACDIETAQRLPYPDGYFDVVTMLAVFEHVRPDRLGPVLGEVHRVLKDGGSYVMTTPSGLTGPILTALKLAGLVSREEIDEHKDSYSAAMIRGIMAGTPFRPERTRLGFFELGLNIWLVARK